MILLALAIGCDDGEGDTGGGVTAPNPPPPAATGPTGTLPTLEGTWEAAVDTYGGSSSSYYTTDSGMTGVEDDFGGTCAGEAQLVVDLGATPPVSGSLDCGTYYELLTLSGEVDGNAISGSSEGVGCSVAFALAYSTSQDTLIGTLAACDAEYGGWVFPVTLVRAGP